MSVTVTLSARNYEPIANRAPIRKIIGIDMGTTNSFSAVIKDGKPVVVSSTEGNRFIPSVVAVDKNGELLVDLPARRQTIVNPENTVFSFSHFMGYSSSEKLDDKVPYKVIKMPKGDMGVVLGGKKYSIPEISGMVLAKIKSKAETYLGEEVTHAIITVPANIYENRRNAIKNAVEIAGFEVMQIINEPTASILAYGLKKKANEIIAVYHLGGSTFEFSILGGDDRDQKIVNWVVGEFKKDPGIDLRNDHQALKRVWDAAEMARSELSHAMKTEINLPYITADASGPKHLLLKLTRKKFEQITDNLAQRSGEGGTRIRYVKNDPFLGGDDFDQRIMDHLIEEFKKDNSINLTNDRQALQRLKEAAERAKIELSTVMETEILLPYLTADASGPKHLAMTLSRSKFEQLTADLVQRSIDQVRKSIKYTKLGPLDIDEVVLVGGMTHMPAVKEAVKKFFGREPRKGVPPDEAAAVGAALFAKRTSGEFSNT